MGSLAHPDTGRESLCSRRVETEEGSRKRWDGEVGKSSLGHVKDVDFSFKGSEEF